MRLRPKATTGPRHGEGWRVAPAVVEQIARATECAASARMAGNTPERATAPALTSRFATIALDEAAQQVRAAYPNVELAPRRDGASLRPIFVGNVVLEWSRRHRYAGASVRGNGGMFTHEWRHAAKLARVLAQLDAEVARHLDVVVRQHGKRLAALASSRSAGRP